jgi:hypothetical protein
MMGTVEIQMQEAEERVFKDIPLSVSPLSSPSTLIFSFSLNHKYVIDIFTHRVRFSAFLYTLFTI